MSNKNTLRSVDAVNPIAAVVAIIASTLLAIIVFVGIVALFAWAGVFLISVVSAGAITVTFLQASAGVLLLSMVGGLLFRRG